MSKAALNLDWDRIAAELDAEGYAVVKNVLSSDQMKELAALAVGNDPAHSWMDLELAKLGKGSVRPLDEPLPVALSTLRDAMYPGLAETANRWAEILGESVRYPRSLREFRQLGASKGQTRAQTTVSRLGEGGFLALNQNVDRDTAFREGIFPLQGILLLSEAGKDFTGGQVAMAEQRPRMQSRPMVVPLQRGDLAIIAVSGRPAKGSKGHYRVNLKHGISTVLSGTRVGIELLFHDLPKEA
jgi:hypothetical protein